MSENKTQNKTEDSSANSVGFSELLAENSLLKHLVDRAEDLIGDTVDCMTDETVRARVSQWYKDKYEQFPS
jgi:hypothetical protein